MKLLILTRFPAEYEPKRLAEEALKIGLRPEIVSYGKVGLSWAKGGISVDLPSGKDFFDFDFFVFRSSSHRNRKSLVGLKTALMSSLPKDKFALNRQTFSRWPVLGKVEQGALLVRKGVFVIPSWFLPDKADREIFYRKVPFPLICKARFGSHSRKTFKLEDRLEAEKLLREEAGEFFFQPLVKSHFYWRVLVLGGKVLGAMKRETNRRFLKEAPGLETPGFEPASSLETQIKTLALEATRALKAEFGGVDILIDEEKNPMVIEVNRTPQFKIFEKRLEINVAREIIDYLTSKAKKRHK